MEKKYKKFLFAIVVLAFLTAGGFASALEIKDYPNVPGVGTITKDSTLPQFVRYFFGLGMYLAGLIALISLTVGAVQYIMSAGNPGMAGDAADRMKGSILGLILLLSAFLIMKTINPVLTTPTITPLPETAGVYYMKGKELRPAQSSDPDLSAQKSEGFNMIKYKCSTKSEPNLIVWLYPKENFNPGSSDYKQVKVILVACEGEINMEGLSLKWMKETEGIYYFMEEGCAGFRSGPVLSSEDQISEPFKNNIKSIKVINNPGTSTYYGAIFHENIGADRGGECTEALMGGAVKNGAIDNYCADVSEYGISPSSVTVFRTNTKPLTSGNGVSFFSKPFGENTGEEAGFYNVKKENITVNWIKPAESIAFDYENVKVITEEIVSCKSFDRCYGSIAIKGDYLVVLFSESKSKRYFCQVFSKDVPNLKKEEFIQKGSSPLIKSVRIIPVK